MKNHRFAVLTGGLLAVAGVTIAAAQDDRMMRPPVQAEAIIYRDTGYKGPAVNVSRPEPNLGLAWRVNSIRVTSGEWQVCERPNYRGDCRTFTRDNPILGLRGMKVQSMRPTGWDSGGGQPVEPGSNPNLRGMAAQFFAAPAVNGYRVLACPTSTSATAACAKRGADQFCSRMGWRTSARQMMETVRGRVYLADVLCSNTGT